jgi:hypothetical protein
MSGDWWMKECPRGRFKRKNGIYVANSAEDRGHRWCSQETRRGVIGALAVPWLFPRSRHHHSGREWSKRWKGSTTIGHWTSEMHFSKSNSWWYSNLQSVFLKLLFIFHKNLKISTHKKSCLFFPNHDFGIWIICKFFLDFEFRIWGKFKHFKCDSNFQFRHEDLNSTQKTKLSYVERYTFHI